CTPIAVRVVGRDESCDQVACAPPSQNPPSGFPATGSPGCSRCILRDLVQLCGHSSPTSECVGSVSPDQQLNLPRCFPMYAAFRALSTTGESDFHRRFCFPQVGPFG